MIQAPIQEPPALFEEIGEQALPGVRTTCGSPEKNYILEVNGGGVLLGDFDGDGKIDVVIVDGSTIERAAKGEPGLPPRLFLGKGDGSFAPAPEAWKLSGGRWGMGGTVGDYDGDGWLDLVVTQWGPTRLFHNEAGHGFREVTEGAGLGPGAWGTSAAFLDYDRDGKLDLFVVEYLEFDTAKVHSRAEGTCTWKGHPVMCGPEGLTPLRSRLFRGSGDGHFQDVSAAAKLDEAPPAFGLGVMTLDFDLDGDTDIYVTNDSTPNQLWENLGDGTFRDVGFQRGVSHDANGREQASMGIACGDWNGDGRDDLFVTNFSGENDVLYSSSKGAGFRERSGSASLSGPTLPLLGWGTCFGDFDLEGDLDLAVFHGHVYPQADSLGTDTSYAQPDTLFENDGKAHFSSRPLSSLGPAVSRACAPADLDGDGDLDLLALRVEGPVRVLRNRALHDERHHWLGVRLRARGGNRFALGARVSLVWKGGGTSAEMRTAGGFQAAVPAELHFGLGSVDKLEKLHVRWPDGSAQDFEVALVDRMLQLEQRAP
ncbi:MAG: CRTAC1 family protein [Planctomycetes bacterium]|nr:CRTAC1 family protein [Planctomycetota bacterium]